MDVQARLSLRGRMFERYHNHINWLVSLIAQMYSMMQKHAKINSHLGLCVCEGVDRGYEDRGGGDTGIEGEESGVEGAESGVEGAGSESRGGREEKQLWAGVWKNWRAKLLFLLENS